MKNRTIQEQKAQGRQLQPDTQLPGRSRISRRGSSDCSSEPSDSPASNSLPQRQPCPGQSGTIWGHCESFTIPGPGAENDSRKGWLAFFPPAVSDHSVSGRLSITLINIPRYFLGLGTVQAIGLRARPGLCPQGCHHLWGVRQESGLAEGTTAPHSLHGRLGHLTRCGQWTVGRQERASSQSSLVSFCQHCLRFCHPTRRSSSRKLLVQGG